MSRDPREPDNGDDTPSKDYLGRILIGLIALAAILWVLTTIL
jgi:hypothetical protein